MWCRATKTDEKNNSNRQPHSLRLDGSFEGQHVSFLLGGKTACLGTTSGLCPYTTKARDEDRHLASPLPSGGMAEKGKLVLATWKILLTAKSAFLKSLQHLEVLLF